MMTKQFSLMIGILGIALLLVGCANDQELCNPVTGQGCFQSTVLGFRVTDSDPFFNDDFQLETQEIRVRFSEAVDPESVAGNVRVTRDFGSAGEPVEGNISFSDGSLTLVFIPNQTYGVNARVQMIISSGVRSVSNQPLAAQTTVQFFTGAPFGAGIGGTTVAGPPNVLSWKARIAYVQGYQCLYFEAEFNEDLIEAPWGEIRECLASCSFLPGTSTRALVEPVFFNSPRVYAIYPSDGWNALCIEPSLAAKYQVGLANVLDRDGSSAVSVSKTFNAKDFGIF